MAETPMDYVEHDRTYHFFVGLTKYGTIAVVVILILMALFLL
ncbi:aa3-type cytochrome c oxidase subunit IV [Mesorhizobium sp. BR1-1-16]|nr:aa3-type cytochrome c oxidase subunit IV [Mesorhizobium sp. BR1-1-16]MBZ9936740.1 aa3-type cytochrome c oxidase subunit IV [Mesorhizobium sp. BR1-1-16]